MKHFQTFRLPLIIIALLIAAGIYADSTAAEPVVKLSGEGSIDLSTDEPSPFVLAGNASHLGRYICSGKSNSLRDRKRDRWKVRE
jgi:hypothetical protein